MSAAPSNVPITIGGWYECTDGTWAEFGWTNGQAVERRRVDSVALIPSRDDDERAYQTWSSEMRARTRAEFDENLRADVAASQVSS